MFTLLEIKAAAAAAAIASVTIAATFFGAGFYRAQGENVGKEATPPAIAVNKGKALFAQSCAPCHGKEADGGEDAPSLLKLDISEAHISLLVHSGIKGEMPSFTKKYSDAEIESIVKYVKTLGK
jgi:cytochrome c oxidase cbb3-type subunit III